MERSDWSAEILLNEDNALMLEQIYENTRPHRFIVKYKSFDSISSSRFLEEMQPQIKPLAGQDCMEVITLADKINPAELAHQLRSAGVAGEIEYIQPDFTLSLEGEIDENYIINRVQEIADFSPLQNQTTGYAMVAVIDTGIDYNHPALQDYIIPGYNFVEGNDQVYDAQMPYDSNHGTHIAGIIAETIRA